MFYYFVLGAIVLVWGWNTLFLFDIHIMKNLILDSLIKFRPLITITLFQVSHLNTVSRGRHFSEKEKIKKRIYVWLRIRPIYYFLLSVVFLQKKKMIFDRFHRGQQLVVCGCPVLLKPIIESALLALWAHWLHEIETRWWWCGAVVKKHDLLSQAGPRAILPLSMASYGCLSRWLDTCVLLYVTWKLRH